MDTKSQIGLQDELRAFGLCDGYIEQQNKYNLPIIPKRPSKELEKECDIALKQIEEKKYSSVLKNAGVEKVLKIGIAFLGKEFEIKYERE